MTSTPIDSRLAMSFASISAAKARNRLYARLAEKKGRQQLAALLDAIASAEETQANRLLMMLRGSVADLDAYVADLQNRKNTISTETYPELEKAYAAESGKYQIEFFDRAKRVSKNHLSLIKKASVSADSGSSVYYTCKVCGFIAKDQRPDKCPICNAVPNKFKKC